MNENLFPWSSTPGQTWKNIEEKRYVMGGFYWTAFDYRGECEKYPSNISSFGAMDLCGFPKDSFFWNKVLWCEEPQIYLSPYREDTTEIAVYSNCETIRMYIDEELIAEVKNDRYSPPIIPLRHKGIIRAEGYIKGVRMCECTAKYPGKAEKLMCSVFVSEDTVIVDCKAYDKNDTFVIDADNLIKFDVNGGEILGVGNGDTTSLESDKSNSRKLYNGCCQLIIKPDDTVVSVTAYADNLETCSVKIEVSGIQEEKEIDNEKCQIPVVDWRMTDPLEFYPSNNIGDLVFAWIPTTVGYGKNLMFSGKYGYGMIAGSFTSPDSKADFVIKKIEGSFDLYFEKKLMLEMEDGVHSNIRIEIPQCLQGKNACATIIFKMHNDNCGVLGNIYIECEEGYV